MDFLSQSRIFDHIETSPAIDKVAKNSNLCTCAQVQGACLTCHTSHYTQWRLFDTTSKLEYSSGKKSDNRVCKLQQWTSGFGRLGYVVCCSSTIYNRIHLNSSVSACFKFIPNPKQSDEVLSFHRQMSLRM